MNYNGYKSAPDTPQIENSIMPTDDLSNTEIRINPSFYIHVLLLDSGKCFLKENAKEGFLQYRLLIEHFATALYFGKNYGRNKVFERSRNLGGY